MASEKEPDNSQVALPADFVEKSKKKFAAISKPEATFEQYLVSEKSEFHRQSLLAMNPLLKYNPTIGVMTSCGNGDLEKEIDPTQWQGAIGPRPDLVNQNPAHFQNFTTGIFDANNLASDGFAHQQWVGTGTDSIVGISTTAPGSTGAVRIGNSQNWSNGEIPCELLSKTFVVSATKPVITFWYAAVFQDGGHSTGNPFFWVRVTDASGNIIPNAFSFGSSDILIADTQNPFFKVKPGTGIVYKDWSCAQIDLSSQVGKQVTVEFVAGDCVGRAHWGYAYIDKFCGDCKGSPAGNLTYDCETSTHCGPGQICFDYTLPQIGKNTGSVTIHLDIYQNGIALTQLTSGALTSGSSYCFNITPASFPGINTSLGGFDFVATGIFSIGPTSLGQIKVSTTTPGQNNDYQIDCKTCASIQKDQDAYLRGQCAQKVNFLRRTSCNCPDSGDPTNGQCHCTCTPIQFPDIKPCISVAWGNSACDCLETDDVEVLCVTVSNCYSNVTFNNLTIGHIQVTDSEGNPVAILPDGTPSVQVIPSGPLCFGDIVPCQGQPGTVSRELVVYTRGAIGKDYKLSFEGICFTVSHSFQSEQCFVMTLCQD
jgi:hypothetical protein